jgi:hypothetical protein
LENNCTDKHYREQAIEKIVLRVLGSCTFSHSLDPKAVLRADAKSSIPPVPSLMQRPYGKGAIW